MPNTDREEQDILTAYDTGQLKSIATKNELARIRSAARATAIKDKRKYVTGRLQER
ncbi:hypothetical protein H0A64_04910 [Alcaligenaceae bacterium]|nr:hypothetical protein [Alcaligenaceae bacterium]